MRRTAARLPVPQPARGLLLTAGVLPALTGVLMTARSAVAIESVLLIYLLVVVLIAVVGGVRPAVVAAVASFLLVNFFLTPPYYTFNVESRDSVIALIVFVVVAVTVSVTVDLAARLRVAAERNRLEADLLSSFTAAPVSDLSVTDVLERVRTTFNMTSVALLPAHRAATDAESETDTDTATDTDEPLALVGPPLSGTPALTVEASDQLRLVATGPQLFAEDRRLLRRLASTAARAWEGQALAQEAGRATELAEVDRLRSALLAAVGHDLRTPLAGIKAAVSSLRQDDVRWTEDEQGELLATIEESADQLNDLIANLLALSRLEAGALSTHIAPVALDEVVLRAVRPAGRGARRVRTDVPDNLPLVLADAGLLERAVANVVDNARRHAPPNQPVEVCAEAREATVALHIVDHGPGVPSSDWATMFLPFQRLGDRRADGGVGLGLAIAQGFMTAMGGSLTPSDTPGGGLTMTMTLAVAR